MQEELDKIKAEITKRIHDKFLVQFEGNKRKFARAVGCDEKAVRLLFDEGSGMTLNFLFKIGKALKVDPSELLKGLHLDGAEESDNL